MKKCITVIVLVVIHTFFFYASCNKERKYAIYIDNNATHQVKFYFDAMTGDHYYPDTILPATKPFMVWVEPGKRFYQDISISWEEFYEQLPSDTLSVYFFHPDTLNAYDWSVICSQKKILKRIDLSIYDLQDSDFTIKYP